MGQQLHSRKLCQLAAREQLEPWTVKLYILRSQTIVWRLVQTHFVVGAREWATQMAPAVNVGLRVPNAGRELDVDP